MPICNFCGDQFIKEPRFILFDYKKVRTLILCDECMMNLLEVKKQVVATISTLRKAEVEAVILKVNERLKEKKVIIVNEEDMKKKGTKVRRLKKEEL